MRRPILILILSLLLAGSSGYLASTAISQEPGPAETTTTITISSGPPGPAGPAGPEGPAGPAGAQTCKPGFVKGELVINHPGGQVTIWTCIKT